MQKFLLLDNKCLRTILCGIFVMVSIVPGTVLSAEQDAFDIAPMDVYEEQDQPVRRAEMQDERIHEIKIEGATTISPYTLLSKIPYRVGDLLTRAKNRQAIHNIYQLGLVSCVQLKAIPIRPGYITLVIVVTEKQPIQNIALEGTYALTSSFIARKLELKSILALDEGDFHALGDKIKKLYAEKNYLHVKIRGEFRETEQGNTEAVIIIEEGEPTYVQRVMIEGNTIVSSSKLKSLLFTREDWLFGFMNRAGSYQPEALEYDRNVIETFYQNHGYLTARVYDVQVDDVPNSCNVNVTFKIREGEQYTICEIHAPETKILSEAEQLSLLSIRPGQIYSRDAIKQSIEALRMYWGEFGYVHAEVTPSIIPDPETRTVAVTLRTTLGETYRLNKIIITGNTKTDDQVIRRQMVLDEGELITTRKLELSKNRVQALGYFDTKTGVNWNVIPRENNTADIELVLQEVKTGQFFAQLGFGGQAADPTSPADKLSLNVGAQNSNWFGRGIQGSISGTFSAQDRSIDLNMSDPWLFDRPLYGSAHFFHRRSRYDDFKLTTSAPAELTTAGFGRLGITIEQVENMTSFGELGFESICFTEMDSRDVQYRNLVSRKFQSGNVLSLSFGLIQDLRNHPTHPTGGYLWNVNAKVGVPYSLRSTDFGFTRTDLDLQWYASLIDEYNLVFRFHAFAGFMHQIENFAIPYRELFHIGGPATVRGFNFGQISPSVNGNPVGAMKAFVVNAELLFPIKIDGSIRGVLFYDGGAGWDTPDKQFILAGLRNNQFNYRHAVGFGVRLTQPTPVSVDVGFKLDRKKRLGESLFEVHFNMTRDF